MPPLPRLIPCLLLVSAFSAAAQDRVPVAVFAAQLPSPALAVAREAGPHDLVAAEASCRTSSGGTPCREVLRLSSGCGVLVHGMRDQRMFATSYDPLAPVAVKTTATGPTRDSAERAAMGQCRTRDRSATCLVVAAACVDGEVFLR